MDKSYKAQINVADICKKKTRQLIVRLALISMVLILFFLLASFSGYTLLGATQWWQALLHQNNAEPDPLLIMWGIRLPRIVLAMLAGAALAVSGLILQGVSQNGLADPGILGINGGAGLGVTIYITSFYGKMQFAPLFALPIAAFAGAALVAAFVFAFARKNGKITPARLLLTGIATSTGISACMLFFTYYMDTYTYDIVKIWMSGSIWGTSWLYVKVAALWCVLLLPIIFYKARRINMLALGDELAAGRGLSVSSERKQLLLLATALSASAVALCGSIGFVGLAAPHMAKRIIGENLKAAIPATMLIGAILVLAADTIGRTIAGAVEIPAGIVTAAIGGPYFIYLLIRHRG